MMSAKKKRYSVTSVSRRLHGARRIQRRGRRLGAKQVVQEAVLEEVKKKEEEEEEEEAVDGGEEIDIKREIVDTTSLLSELFKDIQSTKAARETVEKTKMQQIYDTITSIEGEMDAGMRRVGETVRSVEQAMKLEVRAAVDGVGDKVDIEVDRIRAEAAKLRVEVEGLVEKGRGDQDALLNDAIALSNERISLLKQSLGAEIAESRGLAQSMVDDVGTRMTESDAETRDGIKNLIASRCDHIEATILNEATARAEEDQAISTHVKTIVLAMRREIGEEVSTLRDELIGEIGRHGGELGVRMDSEKKEAEMEREATAAWVRSELEGAAKALENEHEKRIEDESRLLKSFDEDVAEVNDRLSGEIGQLREVVAKQAASIDELQQLCLQQHAQLQQRVLDAETAMRAKVEDEKRERMVEDKRIVDAMNEYTRALQETLRALNASS